MKHPITFIISDDQIFQFTGDQLNPSFIDLIGNYGLVPALKATKARKMLIILTTKATQREISTVKSLRLMSDRRSLINYIYLVMKSKIS